MRIVNADKSASDPGCSANTVRRARPEYSSMSNNGSWYANFRHMPAAMMNQADQ